MTESLAEAEQMAQLREKLDRTGSRKAKSQGSPAGIARDIGLRVISSPQEPTEPWELWGILGSLGTVRSAN